MRNTAISTVSRLLTALAVMLVLRVSAQDTTKAYFTVETTVDELIKGLESGVRAPNELLSEIGRLIGGSAVAIDGEMIGVSPGTFKTSPGFHQLQITRQWMKPWNQNVNISHGATIRVALELSEAGSLRYKTIEGFMASVAVTYAETMINKKGKVDFDSVAWRAILAGKKGGELNDGKKEIPSITGSSMTNVADKTDQKNALPDQQSNLAKSEAFNARQAQQQKQTEARRSQRQVQEQQGIRFSDERQTQEKQKADVKQQQEQLARKNVQSFKHPSASVNAKSYTGRFISDNIGLLAVLLLIFSPIVIFGGVRLSASTSLVIFNNQADVISAFLAVILGVTAGYLLMNDQPRWGLACVVFSVVTLGVSIAYSVKANANGAHPGKSVLFVFVSFLFKLCVSTATICLLIPGIIVGVALACQGLSDSEKGRRKGEGGGRGGWDQARNRKKEAAQNIAIGGASVAFCLWQIRQIPKMIKE